MSTIAVIYSYFGNFSVKSENQNDRTSLVNNISVFYVV